MGGVGEGGREGDYSCHNTLQYTGIGQNIDGKRMN